MRSAAADKKTRQTVEAILEDIETRGDESVRGIFAPIVRQMGPAAIPPTARPRSTRPCRMVPAQAIEDIRLSAREQVKAFTPKPTREHAGSRDRDDCPGRGSSVIAMFRWISVGCYVPGGKYPLIGLAAESIVTAKVGGNRAPASRRRPRRTGGSEPLRDRRNDHGRGRRDTTLSAACKP